MAVAASFSGILQFLLYYKLTSGLFVDRRMGVCCGRYIDPPHIELANQVDKRIQAKQGLKTAEQLAEQNGRFAEVCGDARLCRHRSVSLMLP